MVDHVFILLYNEDKKEEIKKYFIEQISEEIITFVNVPNTDDEIKEQFNTDIETIKKKDFTTEQISKYETVIKSIFKSDNIENYKTFLILDETYELLKPWNEIVEYIKPHLNNKDWNALSLEFGSTNNTNDLCSITKKTARVTGTVYKTDIINEKIKNRKIPMKYDIDYFIRTRIYLKFLSTCQKLVKSSSYKNPPKTNKSAPKTIRKELKSKYIEGDILQLPMVKTIVVSVDIHSNKPDDFIDEIMTMYPNTNFYNNEDVKPTIGEPLYMDTDKGRTIIWTFYDSKKEPSTQTNQLRKSLKKIVEQGTYDTLTFSYGYGNRSEWDTMKRIIDKLNIKTHIIKSPNVRLYDGDKSKYENLGLKLVTQEKKTQPTMDLSRPQSKDRNLLHRDKGYGLYMKQLLTRKITLPIQSIGSNQQTIIETYLKRTIEGRCIPEGFVRPNSIRIVRITYPILSGTNVIIHVIFTALICNPVANIEFKGVITNKTKAGLIVRSREDISPIIVFLARDHHYKNRRFNRMNVGDTVNVRIIGRRFEIGDTYIYCIGVMSDYRSRQEEMTSLRDIPVQYKKPSFKPSSTNAAVWLVMKDEKYIAGALASCWSWKASGSSVDCVCMMTPDIYSNKTLLKDALKVFDIVVEVPYITQESNLRKAIQDKYSHWVSDSYTKWNCLLLDQYEKILFIDADTVIVHCMDELFNCSTPSGTFSSPWVSPYNTKSHKSNPFYEYENHCERIPRDIMEQGKETHFLIGTSVLLKPNENDYISFRSWLNSQKPFGYTSSGSMLDEQSISLFYHEVKQTEWNYIDQRYNAIPWKLNWIMRLYENPEKNIPYIYHYFNIKPWNMEHNTYNSLDLWWSFVSMLINQYPELKKYYSSEQLSSFNSNKNRCFFCEYLGRDDRHMFINDNTNEFECPYQKQFNSKCKRLDIQNVIITGEEPDETFILKGGDTTKQINEYLLKLKERFETSINEEPTRKTKLNDKETILCYNESCGILKEHLNERQIDTVERVQSSFNANTYPNIHLIIPYMVRDNNYILQPWDLTLSTYLKNNELSTKDIITIFKQFTILIYKFQSPNYIGRMHCNIDLDSIVCYKLPIDMNIRRLQYVYGDNHIEIPLLQDRYILSLKNYESSKPISDFKDTLYKTNEDFETFIHTLEEYKQTIIKNNFNKDDIKKLLTEHNIDIKNEDRLFDLIETNELYDELIATNKDLLICAINAEHIENELNILREYYKKFINNGIEFLFKEEEEPKHSLQDIIDGVEKLFSLNESLNIHIKINDVERPFDGDDKTIMIHSIEGYNKLLEVHSIKIDS